DSYLELKVEIQTTIRGALQESEVYYGDYEQVNGIYYPFAVEQAQKGSASRAQFSVEKIEQNIPLEDAHFAMPVSKPESDFPSREYPWIDQDPINLASTLSPRNPPICASQSVALLL